MKKQLIVVVSALLICAFVVGCGNDKKENAPAPQGQSTQQGRVTSTVNSPQSGVTTPGISNSAPNASNAPTPSPDNTPEYDADAIRAEATPLYKKLYDAVCHIEENPDNIRSFIGRYGRAYENQQAESYERFTEGSKEDYLAFGTLERFLWQETYLLMLDYISQSNYDFFFGDESRFLTSISSTTSALKNAVSQEASDAYKELMLWQYEFIKKYATVYNFITEERYSDTGQNLLESANK